MTVAWLFQYLYKLQMMVSGLAEWDAAEAAEFCRLFCSLFEALSREAEEKGKHTWSMKPKLHLMQESCLQFLRALGLGPRPVWESLHQSFPLWCLGGGF